VTPDFDQELYFEKLGMLPRIDCRQKKEFMAYSQSENIRPGSDGPSTLNDKKKFVVHFLLASLSQKQQKIHAFFSSLFCSLFSLILCNNTCKAFYLMFTRRSLHKKMHAHFFLSFTLLFIYPSVHVIGRILWTQKTRRLLYIHSWPI
jgi:hypothetical protein